MYAFVEQVMRPKKPAALAAVYPGDYGLSAVELRLLYHTIRFLEPQRVVLVRDNADQYQDLLVKLRIPVVVQSLPDLYSPEGRDLILFQASEKLFPVPDPIRDIAASGKGRLLLLGPHRNAASKALWDSLRSDKKLQLSLDYWFFGLMIADPAFKEKQHFYLR